MFGAEQEDVSLNDTDIDLGLEKLTSATRQNTTTYQAMKSGAQSRKRGRSRAVKFNETPNYLKMTIASQAK